MDDILILRKTRWHNKKVIKAMNQIFNQLKLKQHPDKTLLGRIKRGFDFLGYHFSTEPLQLAKITVRKHVERYRRLYEQLKRKKANTKDNGVNGFYAGSIKKAKDTDVLNVFYAGRIKKANSDELAFVLEQYVKRWQCWCTAGLGIISLIYDGKDLNLKVLSP